MTKSWPLRGAPRPWPQSPKLVKMCGPQHRASHDGVEFAPKKYVKKKNEKRKTEKSKISKNHTHIKNHSKKPLAMPKSGFYSILQ